MPTDRMTLLAQRYGIRSAAAILRRERDELREEKERLRGALAEMLEVFTPDSEHTADVWQRSSEVLSEINPTD